MMVYVVAPEVGGPIGVWASLEEAMKANPVPSRPFNFYDSPGGWRLTGSRRKGVGAIGHKVLRRRHRKTHWQLLLPDPWEREWWNGLEPPTHERVADDSRRIYEFTLSVVAPTDIFVREAPVGDFLRDKELR